MRALVLTCLIAALPACTDDTPPPRAPASDCEPTNLRELAKSVVTVGAEKAQPTEDAKYQFGGGIMIDDRGHVLTALHVLRDTIGVQVSPVELLPSGAWASVPLPTRMRVRAIAEQYDVAMLAPMTSQLVLPPARVAKSVGTGDTIHALLRVSGPRHAVVDNDDYPMPEHARSLSTSIDSRYGDSGSPVFDGCSGIVGIMVEGRVDGNESFFVPADEAMDAMRAPRSP